VKCIETRPPVYLVKDDHGEILEGTFYVEELQTTYTRLNPFLKREKWDKEFSSWILKQDLQKHTTPT
jgi:hypothetical protein